MSAMRVSVLRTMVVVFVAVIVGFGGTACGGGDNETTTAEDTTTGQETTAVGREIFVANCGTCHTLSDAGTSGSIGPVLDGGGYSVDRVDEQVRNGGGGMPAFEDTLSDDEIAEVAAYVAAATSG